MDPATVPGPAADPTPDPPAPVRVGEPRDLLAVVPHLVGHVPSSSLVAVGVRGGWVAPPVLRLDLPRDTEVVTPADVAAVLAPLLHGEGQRRSRAASGPVGGPSSSASSSASSSTPLAVALVVYDATRDHDEAEERWLPLVVAAHDAVRAAGAEALDLLSVAAASWRSWWCSEPGCCPPSGRPLTELQLSPAAVALVWSGSAPLPSREALVAAVDPAPVADRAAVARAMTASRPPAGEAARRAWRQQSLRAWRAVLGRGGPACAEDRAFLLAGLQDVVVRDAVLACCDASAHDAPDELVAGRPAAVERLWGGKPVAVVVDPVRAALEDLARHATATAAAPPLGALAWLAWWTGDGARARLLVGRALAADPRHRLAGLVGELLDACVPPPWASAG